MRHGTPIRRGALARLLRMLWARRRASPSSDQCGRVRRLVIRLDNGPICASNRKPFLKRMVAFARNTGLEIHLVYYPPYPSKYNPIERVWGVCIF